MRKTRLTLAAAVATALLAAGPAQAQTSTPQLVSGTTVSSLAIGATTPAVLTNFSPGQTATSLAPSPMTVISTGPWTLEAEDATGNQGHLAAAALGCTGSDALTDNALGVQSASNGSTVGTVNHTAQTISDVAAPVADSSLAQVFEVSYSLGLNPIEQLVSGCVYSTTVTWTVQ